jgi:photosystem II stability/assembly factor-like uncharacterized protein
VRRRISPWLPALVVCAGLGLRADGELLRAEGAWYRYPLPGAEVKSLVADPSDRGVFYVGTAQGGIYRSTDGGRSWLAPHGGAPFPGYAVTAIAVDPLRRGTIWLGLTGVVKGGLLARSDDRGATFLEVRRWPEHAAARVVAVAKESARRILAVGGDYGIEVSEDDGLTWRASLPALDPGAAVSFLAFHPSRPGVMFCGSFRHPFRSLDTGRTWKRIANGMIEDTEVFALDFAKDEPDTFWAATCGWVYRTTDGGGSWTRYKDGLVDRRSHVVRVDPRDPARVLVGTTGGLFESTSAPRVFHRLGTDLVVNTLAFDPHDPRVLLVGTEADGVLRSEDGGASVLPANDGLAEARVSSVATTAKGTVVMSRAADGPSGGLWSLDPATGEAAKLSSPPATVLALAASGERIVAGTPDGVFVAERPGEPFTLTLARAARGFAQAPGGHLLAATDGGVFDSADGGRRWARAGTLTARVEHVKRARFTGVGAGTTFAIESGGRTLWWDGRDWVFQPVRYSPGGKLGGGFGRPPVTLRWTPDPIGIELDASRSLLVYRPEEEDGQGVFLALPEPGLSVGGWSGDPRSKQGLFLATLGRGLFRFVPGPPPEAAALALPEAAAPLTGAAPHAGSN